MISAILTLSLLVPLSLYSVKFFNEANENRRINEVVNVEVARINGTELVELDVQRTPDGLSMIITVRTGVPLQYEQVVDLQKAIVNGLQQSVSLKVNQVFAERLDPLIPPTLTPTAQFTQTLTQTPTPTKAYTPIPTLTLTPTPTPGLVQVTSGIIPPIKLYQSPGGPVIGQILRGQVLTLLYDRKEVNGLIWVNVMDNERRIGWVPEIYLYPITATPD